MKCFKSSQVIVICIQPVIKTDLICRVSSKIDNHVRSTSVQVGDA